MGLLNDLWMLNGQMREVNQKEVSITKRLDMKKCPKCSLQYDDDVKICRTCGAILELALEEPQQVVEPGLSLHEDDVCETASAKQPPWTCSQCGQSVPGGFEVCWNCGTSQDGVADPDFSKEQTNDDDGFGAWQPPEHSVAAKQTAYRCLKCGSSKIIPNTKILDQGHYSDGKLQVVVDGDPDALFFKDRLHDRLLANICGDCGHVELKVEHAEELYEHYLQSKHG